MKTHLFVVLALVLLATGCGHADFNARGQSFNAAGMSRNPEVMTSVLYQGDVAQMNAQTHRDCVLSGRCYPYAGGGYGNDYWYHYRNVVPTPPVQPAPLVYTPAVSSSSPQSGEYATKAELECETAPGKDAARVLSNKTPKGPPEHCKKKP